VKIKRVSDRLIIIDDSSISSIVGIAKLYSGNGLKGKGPNLFLPAKFDLAQHVHLKVLTSFQETTFEWDVTKTVSP
jgi:hypothetical protein